MERTALHKAMWRTDTRNWIIVPLYKETDEHQLRTLEENLITKLKPNLNRRRKKRKNPRGKRNRPPKHKRERKMGIDKDDKGLTLWNWNIGEEMNLDFSKIIERKRTPIIWQKGIIDITNWESLKKRYRIEVSIGQEFGDIEFMRKEMKRKDSGVLKIVRVTRRDKGKEEWARECMKKDLKNLDEETLVKLWRKRDLFKKSEKMKMTKKLNAELTRRKGMGFPKSLTLKIPYRRDGKKRNNRKDPWMDWET